MNEKELHKKFCEYGQNARKWLRRCALLLPEIDGRQIWRKKGFGSIYEYAAKIAGMSHSSVDDALRVMKHVIDKPALRAVVEEHGVNRVRPVVAIATAETAEFWAGKAKKMGKGELEMYVHEYKKEFRTSKGSNSVLVNLFPEKSLVTVELAPDLARKLERVAKREDFEELVKSFLENIEKQEVVEQPQPVISASRHIPVKIRCYVEKRSGGRCEFPGCQRKGEIFHHTQRWSSEKVHDPGRIRLLCKNHERLAHQGLIANEKGPPETWRIRLAADTNQFAYLIDQKVQEFRRAPPSN